MRLAGLTARLQGLWHVLRGHNIEWRAYAEPGECEGDIVCETCKRDSVGLLFIILGLLWWASLISVAAHFIAKFWRSQHGNPLHRRPFPDVKKQWPY